MNLRTEPKQTSITGLSHCQCARLSLNGRFLVLLIAVLLVTWNFTGAHNATLAAPSTTPLTVANATNLTTHHAAMVHHQNAIAYEPGDISVPHDYCADLCLSVMLPATSFTVISREVTLPPEIPAAHWKPWRAEQTTPPPKHGSFSTLA